MVSFRFFIMIKQEVTMEITFTFIVELIGTIAFAISGIRLAAYKRFDWFGAYVVGLVTAIGGGTLRDLLLGIPVFWMQTPVYLAATAVALSAVILIKKPLVTGFRSLFLFDAIGLALFVITGISKTIDVGYPMWVAIIMGCITGAFGGVVRDILINEEPLFFRKEIYATACLAGGVIYWLVSMFAHSDVLPDAACAVVVIGLRILANHYHWRLPILKVDSESEHHRHKQ
jgi:uncharacterized membrane protein YeiH